MQATLRLVRRFIAVAALGVLASGCPQLLDDEFETVAGNDASVGGAAGGGGVAGVGGDASLGGAAGTSGTGGGDASPCAACQADETCCDDQCVDTSKSQEHCGACGSGCPGTTCVSGQCTNTCALGYLDCDQNAVNGCEANAAIDTENCGSCGAQCNFDQTCVAGKCVCAGSTADCDNDFGNGCEVELATDPESCGACGKSCGPNQTCSAGSCACAQGFADCNAKADDGCETNLLTSTAHCGACSKSCGQNGSCASGKCGCLAGFLDCDAAAGCESKQSDPQSCGACGTVCSGANPVCNGASCVASCSGNEQLCGASCVQIDSDPSHCGGCNQPVGKNQICSAGKPTCVAGFADCNSLPGDGCEIDTTSDPSHCGSCSSTCKPGAVCSASACQCGASTPNDCGAECRECCQDNDCSDSNPCTTETCGSGGKCSTPAACSSGTVCCALGCFECCVDGDCGNGTVCSANQCVTPSCTSPEILCNTKCVNPTTDPDHCGGCGIDCGVGRSCSAGKCTPAWTSVATSGAPSAVSHAAYASLSNPARVFVWGGQSAQAAAQNVGAIYDVGTDSWSPVGTDQYTPSKRILASAVWTGSAVFVWGGGNLNVDYADGALYTPSSNTWKPVSNVGAPSARRAPYLAWTGSRVLLFGGMDKAGQPIAGAHLYDPAADSWSSAASLGQPPALLGTTNSWSGSELFVFGGLSGGTNADKLHAYRPAQDTWLELANGPTQRHSAFGAWDGSVFFVWGGRKEGSSPTTLSDGKRYNRTNDNWSNVAAANEPSARHAPWRETGWSARTSAGSTLLVGGRSAAGAVLRGGAIYTSNVNNWTTVPDWPSGEEHLFGVGAWAGGELVIWGGVNGTAVTATGERFRP